MEFRRSSSVHFYRLGEEEEEEARKKLTRGTGRERTGMQRVGEDNTKHTYIDYRVILPTCYHRTKIIPIRLLPPVTIERKTSLLKVLSPILLMIVLPS